MKKALITGVAGQDGSYLAKYLLKKNYQVTGILKESQINNLFRHEYLGINNKIEYSTLDLLDLKVVEKYLKENRPDEIYNLAAYSSVGYSFKEPYKILKNNNTIILNLLESMRRIGERIKLYQAGSSEMYGNPSTLPVTLDTPINPISPYGLSKAFGYHSVKNYRRNYNLFAVTGIMFNHESFLRDENYFIKKLIKQALKLKSGEIKKIYFGNIEVKRDFGFSPDYIKAMWKMLQNDRPKDYIVCSGESISLKSVIDHVFERLNLSTDRVETKKSLYRPSEIKNIYGENSRIKKELNWKYDKSFFDVLEILIEEETDQFNSSA